VHIFCWLEKTEDFSRPNKDQVFPKSTGRGSGVQTTLINGQPVVRKSEGIAKICGEPRGGCAKLKSVREIGFLFRQ
jgi:hypothetical protein